MKLEDDRLLRVVAYQVCVCACVCVCVNPTLIHPFSSVIHPSIQDCISFFIISLLIYSLTSLFIHSLFIYSTLILLTSPHLFIFFVSYY